MLSKKLHFAFNLDPLTLAIDNAECEISDKSISIECSKDNVIPIHPLPQPKSNILLFGKIYLLARSTNNSVSGRGSNT